MIVLATAAEGWGLARWGKWQSKFQRYKEFTSTGSIVTFEVIQGLLLLAMVFLSALLLLKISQTFQNRQSYLKAFTTMAYGFSPLLLVRLLDAGPTVHPATTWGIGIVLTFWVLYQGIPHVMQPDPTHAFGVYLSSMFVVVLTSGLASCFHRDVSARVCGLPSFLAVEQISRPVSMNSSLERQLLAALTHLDETVKSLATANPKPSLLPLFSQLDELTAQLPRDTDPDVACTTCTRKVTKRRGCFCKVATRRIKRATAAMCDGR